MDAILGYFTASVGAVLTILGLAVLGYQSVPWLREGSWTPIVFATVYDWFGWIVPTASGDGVQKIIVWFLPWPLGLTALLLGVPLAWLGSAMVGASTPE